MDFQTVPSLVRALLGVPVTQISAGGAHTLVLTLHGLVYCCGANNAGQLGLKRVDEKGTVHCQFHLLSFTRSFVKCDIKRVQGYTWYRDTCILFDSLPL